MDEQKKHYLFDVSLAMEVAKPIVADLHRHLSHHEDMDAYSVINAWFMTRLSDMKLIIFKENLHSRIPLAAAVFLDTLPPQIHAAVDTALYQSVRHMWGPDTQVETKLSYDTLLITT